jgi:hypothetical protein
MLRTAVGHKKPPFQDPPTSSDQYYRRMISEKDTQIRCCIATVYHFRSPLSLIDLRRAGTATREAYYGNDWHETTAGGAQNTHPTKRYWNTLVIFSKV